MISSEQAEVGFGSMLCVATLKLVELGTVCEGIVAVLSCESKYVSVVGSAGTCCGVRDKESRATPKENINNRAEWSSADKMFGDDCLIVTVRHVGGEGCRSRVLDEGSIDAKILNTKTDRDPGGDNKARVIS